MTSSRTCWHLVTLKALIVLRAAGRLSIDAKAVAAPSF
jgi:hypothetical protein